jgi:hypothetical protein
MFGDYLIGRDLEEAADTLLQVLSRLLPEGTEKTMRGVVEFQSHSAAFVPVYSRGDKTYCSNYHCYQLRTTEAYPTLFSQG